MPQFGKSFRIIAASDLKALQLVAISPPQACQIPREITCYPVPGQGVVNYEPGWLGLTKFG